MPAAHYDYYYYFMYLAYEPHCIHLCQAIYIQSVVIYVFTSNDTFTYRSLAEELGTSTSL